MMDMLGEYVKFMDDKLTKDKITMYDREGVPHSTGTFPYLSGSNLHSEIPYEDDEQLDRMFKMYQDLGDIRR